MVTQRKQLPFFLTENVTKESGPDLFLNWKSSFGRSVGDVMKIETEGKEVDFDCRLDTSVTYVWFADYAIVTGQAMTSEKLPAY